MIRNIARFCLLFLVGLAACSKSNLPVSNYDLMKWPRITSVAFGCFLEKEFGYRDAVFNCSNTSYTNQAGPSDAGYYEGPEFPAGALKKIHPAVASIRLEFEHGDLREITVELDRDYRREDVRKMFRLPAPEAPLPENVQSVAYGENIFYKGKNPDPDFTKYFSLTGFDHIGAGETD